MMTKLSDIIFFLIPDAVQEKFYNKYLLKNLKKGHTLVFAHGFSLYYKTIKIPKNINTLLLAPRNPGKIVRDKFLNNSGSIAFYGIHQDYTKSAEKIVYTLAKDLGFIKGGLLKVSIEDETKIDLFIEQFMAPLFYRSVYESLKFLTSKGLNSLAASLELYLSGETGSVRLMQSKYGLYNALIKNASPTCQFGIANSYPTIFPKELKQKMKKVFLNIENNKFAKELEKDRSKNFLDTKTFFNKLKKNIVSKNEKIILK
jgi:ketol-acid reductoisomerase